MEWSLCSGLIVLEMVLGEIVASLCKCWQHVGFVILNQLIVKVLDRRY